MELKSAICIRIHDPVMRPLYRHLAALPTGPGKPYRARVLCALLEAGSSLVFAPGDALAGEMVRAARSVMIEAPVTQTDGRPIRVELVLPDTPPMQPLLRRLAELPGGPGAQARSRLIMRMLQAAVRVVYGDLPPATAGDAAAPACAMDPAVREDMLGFMDTLSMDGL